MERLIISVTSSDEDTGTASETDGYSGTDLDWSLGTKGTDRIISAYCKFGSFRKGFIFAKLPTCEIS